MNIDINALGYRWQGFYGTNIAYKENDVVYKDGNAVVYRNGLFVPFAVGQQDAVVKGQLLTGGISVGGLPGMTLHSNGNGGVEFRYQQDRVGTYATKLLRNSVGQNNYHATAYFMSAIMTDGGVKAWGRLNARSTGTGAYGDISRTFPVNTAFPPGTPRIVDMVCNGTNITLYLDAKGQIWSTGNDTDATGTGGDHFVPIKINGSGDIGTDTVIKKIYAARDWSGYTIMGALDEDGRVYFWGNNRYTCQGIGTSGTNPLPRVAITSTKVPMKDVFMQGGLYMGTWMIDIYGRLWARGEYNTVGVGSANDGGTEHFLFMPWGENNTVKMVASHESDAHWIAGEQYYRSYGVVLDNGDLYRWGQDGGQTSGGWGDGTTGDIFVASPRFPLKCAEGVSEIHLGNGGYPRSVRLDKDGSVWGTGYSGYSWATSANRNTWAQLNPDLFSNVATIHHWGGQHGSSAYALRSDGLAIVWGMGGFGQPGTGYYTGSDSGTISGFVLLDKPIIDVMMSGHNHGGSQGHTYHFLTNDGRVYSSGSGSYAMNGDDDSENSAVPKPILF